MIKKTITTIARTAIEATGIKKLGISFYVQNLSKTVDKLFYMSGLYEIMTKLEREDEI